MKFTSIPQPLAWLLLASLASGQTIENLSFGHRPNANQGIHGWATSAQNHNILYYSDRLVLTPPVPGNVKAGLWTEATSTSASWSAELEFRASGEDGGSGSLQVWYVGDKSKVGVNSVYNVGNFDGFALVIDQYGGQGGTVRGFLNDGSQNYREHPNMESLAFGHCNYHYRNLGRPSKIKITSQNGLTVTVDDNVCFSSDKVSLPAGSYFGITAATPDIPDSFEINKFVVTPADGSSSGYYKTQEQPSGQAGSRLEKLDNFPGSPEVLPDASPDDFKSQQDQFADLHNRMQSLAHLLTNMLMELSLMRSAQQTQHDATLERIQTLAGSKETGMPPETINTITAISARLTSLERLVEQVKRDVEGRDYRDVLNNLNAAVDRVQGGLTEHLPERIGHCKFLLFFLDPPAPGNHKFSSALTIRDSTPRRGSADGTLPFRNPRCPGSVRCGLRRLQAPQEWHAEEVSLNEISATTRPLGISLGRSLCMNGGVWRRKGGTQAGRGVEAVRAGVCGENMGLIQLRYVGYGLGDDECRDMRLPMNSLPSELGVVRMNVATTRRISTL